MHLYAGDATGAIRVSTHALTIVPVNSRLYPLVRANLMDALAKSGDPEGLAAAIAMFPEMERCFLGVKRVSAARAKFAWMTGGARAKHAVVFELKGWERKKQIARAKRDLEKAVEGLKKMPLEAAAARIDLAAVNLLLDPLEVAQNLEDIDDVPALEKLKSFAVDLANQTCSLERIAKLWGTLREMRDVTVAAGCDPPLVPFAG
jgi:hypothetical protein